MVIVEKEVIMLVVTQDLSVEQAPAVQVKCRDQPVFLEFDISDVPYLQRPLLVVHVNRLDRVTVAVQLDAGKEGGVGFECRLDSGKQAVSVQTAVKHIDIREIVEWLSLVTRTLHIDSKL